MADRHLCTIRVLSCFVFPSNCNQFVLWYCMAELEEFFESWNSWIISSICSEYSCFFLSNNHLVMRARGHKIDTNECFVVYINCVVSSNVMLLLCFGHVRIKFMTRMWASRCKTQHSNIINFWQKECCSSVDVMKFAKTKF